MDQLTAHRFGDHTLQQATDATTGRFEGLPGCWKLGGGRALTLHAGQAGVLQIAHGRVWVTYSHASDDLRVRAGDHFLSRGESLALSPGETVVMESYGLGHASSSYFSWEPSFAAQGVPATTARRDVVQPLLDLRLALGLVVGAVGRLARGLAGAAVAASESLLTGFALIFVTSRARTDFSACTFSAQPKETRAQCSIN